MKTWKLEPDEKVLGAGVLVIVGVAMLSMPVLLNIKAMFSAMRVLIN